jgi:hypothetical protein
VGNEKLHDANRYRRGFAMSRRARRLLTLCPVLAALLVAGCGGSSKSSATKSTPTHSTSTQQAASSQTTSTTSATPPVTVPAGSHSVDVSSAGVTASLRAGTHSPKVEAPWPIHFTVTRGGQPVAASVSYEYMLGGQVVAHRSHYTFKGHFSDIFKWPASAVGFPLTFRAVIVAGGVTINLDYPVQVSR